MGRQLAQAEAEGRGDDPAVVKLMGDFEDDEETVKGMAHLFAEVGEAYCGLVATGKWQAPPGLLLALALLAPSIDWFGPCSLLHLQGPKRCCRCWRPCSRSPRTRTTPYAP